MLEMETTDPEALEALDDLHRVAGDELYAACGGQLYPCDTLAFALLGRSITLCKSFRLLMGNGGYVVAVAVLRMQLDNLLRLYGVIDSRIPHVVANEIIQGKPLKDIKGRNGKLMSDKNLRNLIVSKDPSKRQWIDDAYELASGYVHLSNHHVYHFLGQSPVGEDGKRMFAIDDNDEHIPQSHKDRLFKAFSVITNTVVQLVRTWADLRGRPNFDGVSKDLNLLFKDPV
jgi:hypothetical protein